MECRPPHGPTSAGARRWPLAALDIRCASRRHYPQVWESRCRPKRGSRSRARSFGALVEVCMRTTRKRHSPRPALPRQRRRRGGTHRSRAAVPHATSGGVSLWEWARLFIRHALGDLADFASEWPTGAAAAVCAFLARCWRSPTLGRLASDGEEEAFKLVLMTLFDDMVLVTSRRMNHIKWTTGGETQSATRVEAFEDWLKRATPRATERAA